MKTFVVTLLAVLASSPAFANRYSMTGSESSRAPEIISGTIVRMGCADSNIGIRTRSGEKVCLGFGGDLSEDDLIVGNRYTLGGELTEDGFYPNEFLD